MLSLPVEHHSDVRVNLDTTLKIFDPRYNTYRLPNQFTFEDLRWLLQQVYTRSNLQQHPELLSGFRAVESMHRHFKRYLKTQELILPLIPDNKLWLLAFCVFGEYSRGDTTIYATTPDVAAMTHYGNGQYYISAPFLSTSVTSDNLITVVDAFLTNLDKLAEIFAEHASKHVYKRISISENNDFTSALLRMYSGLKYIFSETDPYEAQYTANQIKTLLSEAGSRYALRAATDSFKLSLVQIITNEHRDALYRILNYSTNPCNMLQWPRKAEREQKPVLYGVELEIATSYDIRPIIDAQKELFFIAKQDGSITGSGRTKAELVTVPMSLRAHKKDWAHWFRKLDYTQFDCTTQTNNGQHIHIDRQAFLNNTHRDNFIWFFLNPCNKEFITAMSERTPSSMAMFAPLPSFGSSASLVKCYRNIYTLASGMRGAINVSSNKPTVEVRLFRGIVSYASILKNLEFVDAAFHFTQDLRFQQNTLDGFFLWLNGLPRNRYKVLRKYFGMIAKLPMMIDTATLSATIYNINDPVKVIEAVNSSKLKISSHIATILNKNRKRTYIFNKKTGMLELDQSFKSKVAFLDRKLEAIYTRDVA
jgi:hypothetical protein